MSGITPDMDDLMWSLADRRDPAANAEFLRKHPDLAAEFSKRCTVVSQLRQSKMAPPAVVPAFVLRPHPQGIQMGKWLVGGISLAGLAAVSFFVTNNFLSQQPSQPLQTKAAITSAAPFGSNENVDILPINKKGARGRMGQDVENSLEAHPQRSASSAAEVPVPLMKRPVSVHEERIEVSAALQSIARQAGYSIELAPDMVNPEVKLDYDNASPENILSDLGKRYGFTVFDEGESHLLVIPAIDRAKGQGGFVSQPADVPAQNAP